MCSGKVIRAALFGLAVVCSAAPVAGDTVSVDRLFEPPALYGDAANSFQMVQNDTGVLYVRSPAISPHEAELWLYDRLTATSRRVLGAGDLPPLKAPSLVEWARDERLRRRHGGITGFDVSPDKTRALFAWGGDVYIHDLATAQTKPLTKTPAPEMDPSFSPDGSHVAYVRDGDLYLYDLAAGRERRLTNRKHKGVRYGVAEYIAAEEMRRMTGYFWSPRSDQIAVIRTDTKPVGETGAPLIFADGVRPAPEPYPYAGGKNVAVQLLLLGVDDGRRRNVRLDLNGGYLARLMWLPDGSGFLAVIQSRDQKTLRLSRYSMNGEASGDVLVETDEVALPLHDDLVVLPRQGDVLWRSARPVGERIYRYTLRGELLGPLTPPDMYVDGIVAVDEEQNKLYVEGWVNDPLSRHLYVMDLDPATADAPVNLTPEEGLHQTKVFPKQNMILDRHAHVDAPPSVVIRDLTGASLGYLIDNRVVEGHPYAPYKPHHVTPVFGSLTAPDGTPLYYRFYKPAATGRVPVIVYMYGGPGVQVVTRGFDPLWIQAAVAKGYGVFSLDNRGSGRRGRDFARPLYGGFGDVDVTDQRLGLAYLRSLPFVDANRLALYGWSYGGYLALKVAAAEGEAVRAAIAGAPATDWRLYDTHYTERYLGRPQDNAALYDKAGVLADVPKLGRSRLLLVHGLADDNVLMAHATKLMAALQAQGTVFEMAVYPGVGHGFRRPEQDRQFHRLLFDFFDRTLAAP